MTLVLKSLPEAEKFVQEQQQAGNDCRWQGWDILFFRPEPRGAYNVNGAFRNGAWGFENKFSVNDDGTWGIDYRNVRKRTRSPRN